MPLLLAMAAGCLGANPAYGPGATDVPAPPPLDAGPIEPPSAVEPLDGPSTIVDAPAPPPVDALGPAVDGPAVPDAMTDSPDAPVDLGPVNLQAGLVGFWEFDQTQGATQARDRSSFGHHASLFDLDPDTSWVAGRRNGAIQVPDLARGAPIVTSAPAIDALQRFTLAAWVNRARNVTERPAAVVSRLQNDIRYLYYLGFSNNLLSFEIYAPTPVRALRSMQPAPVGSWVHVAATYDGGVARLYQQGSEVDVLTHTVSLPPASSRALLLGNRIVQGVLEHPLAGRLDDVLIYDRALTAGEIAALAGGSVP